MSRTPCAGGGINQKSCRSVGCREGEWWSERGADMSRPGVGESFPEGAAHKCNLKGRARVRVRHPSYRNSLESARGAGGTEGRHRGSKHCGPGVAVGGRVSPHIHIHLEVQDVT